jgi:hypothetical protein
MPVVICNKCGVHCNLQGQPKMRVNGVAGLGEEFNKKFICGTCMKNMTKYELEDWFGVVR